MTLTVDDFQLKAKQSVNKVKRPKKTKLRRVDTIFLATILPIRFQRVHTSFQLFRLNANIKPISEVRTKRFNTEINKRKGYLQQR